MTNQEEIIQSFKEFELAEEKHNTNLEPYLFRARLKYNALQVQYIEDVDYTDEGLHFRILLPYNEYEFFDLTWEEINMSVEDFKKYLIDFWKTNEKINSISTNSPDILVR